MNPRKNALVSKARQNFHKNLLSGPLTVDDGGVVSIADRASKASRALGAALVQALGKATVAKKAGGQSSGKTFEDIVRNFVNETFCLLGHLRPGHWEVGRGGTISQFEQYAHLAELSRVMEKHPAVRAALGGDYLISPDIVIVRHPEPDSVINNANVIVDDQTARATALRKANSELPLLHASISCKWTLRSDRAQNVRTEAQNLLRNRKGQVPHIVSVTAEPLPSRIASLAQGHADLDAVYHIALYELTAAAKSIGHENEYDILKMLVEGKRLKDISDLPLDLAI